ncbi:HAD family phosphatase [bacterium]|nr:HAD family phosphatase [bacterium]
MIFALLFDMDGLMVDTEPLYTEAAQEIARKAGKEFTLEIKQEMMGRLGIDSMRIFKERLSLLESEDVLLEERGIAYDKLLRERGVKPMPGLFELIHLASSLGLLLAVASSCRKKWVDFILSELNIRARFKAILTGDDVTKGKPDPEIYLKAAEKLGVLPQHCLVLEDAPLGVLSGKRAGAACIAVLSQHTKGFEFKEADLVVESLSEVTEEVLRRF